MSLSSEATAILGAIMDGDDETADRIIGNLRSDQVEIIRQECVDLYQRLTAAKNALKRGDREKG